MTQNDEIVIADVEPGATEGIAFSDLIRYGPIVAEVIHALEDAIASGTTSIPVLKVRVAGRHLEIGPTPIKVS